MTTTKPLSLSKRVAGYKNQMDWGKRRLLTPKQRRRATKKFNRADKRGQKDLLI